MFVYWLMLKCIIWTNNLMPAKAKGLTLRTFNWENRIRSM